MKRSTLADSMPAMPRCSSKESHPRYSSKGSDHETGSDSEFESCLKRSTVAEISKMRFNSNSSEEEFEWKSCLSMDTRFSCDSQISLKRGTIADIGSHVAVLAVLADSVAHTMVSRIMVSQPSLESLPTTDVHTCSSGLEFSDSRCSSVRCSVVYAPHDSLYSLHGVGLVSL
jgi:hypothetical protein